MPEHQAAVQLRAACQRGRNPGGRPATRCVKISGFNTPSRADEAAFQAAVDEIAAASRKLLDALETQAPPKNREVEAAKARIRAETQRFAR